MVVRLFMSSGKNVMRIYNVKPSSDYNNIKQRKPDVEIKFKSNLVKTCMSIFNYVGNDYKNTNYINNDKRPFSLRCNKYNHKAYEYAKPVKICNQHTRK